MAIQVINVGSRANGGGGDPLRTAMIKINDNFQDLYPRVQALEDGTIVSDIVANDSTILVSSTFGYVNADVLQGTIPTGVMTWENIGSTPDSLGEYGILDAYTKAQVDQLIDIAVDQMSDGTTDFKGSFFADDSTLLVDGVNGTIPASVISGTLSGVAVSTADITGYGVFTGTEEAFATLTGATGTVAHDCDNGHIFYHTGAVADWTANFTNLGLTAEHATTLSIVISQGATAYIPSAVQIGGVAQTILWQGGSAPSGTADGTDVVAFSVLNDGGTYVVMGQLVGFS
jgi:hypothetical protein